MSIATFLRTEDGNLQICALNSNLGNRPGGFYEVLDCMVRPLGHRMPEEGTTAIADKRRDHRACSETPLIRLSEVAGEVLVFINRALESVNHLFFDELVSQAMREDCGLATGITVDLSGKIIHSGFTIAADGSPADKFTDCMLSDFIGMPESHEVRRVDAISDEFFAIRRERLTALGGLSAISSSRMPRLVGRLILNASKRGLRVLVTPFAVATVEVQHKHREEYVSLGGVHLVDELGYCPDVTHITGESERNVQFEDMSTAAVPAATQINIRYTVWKYVIPLPPDVLIGSVGAPSIENFLVVGDAWGQIVSRHTPENATVLDIGCGCGRSARVLVNNPWIRSYIGFDVMGEHVQWCRNFVEPAWPGVAEFHWFDLHSGKYNPSGALKAEDLTFPSDDESVDVVFAASVFTHLFEADALHYLQEIRRVLSARGVALVSIHENVVPGQRISGTEARIDIDPSYFVELAGNAGLCERESVAEFCGQRLFLLQRAE